MICKIDNNFIVTKFQRRDTLYGTDMNEKIIKLAEFALNPPFLISLRRDQCDHITIVNVFERLLIMLVFSEI